jgi:hypothetical protein
MASFGIFLAIAVAVFTIYHREHKVIKSSGRELSLMIWIGVMINHFNTFLIFFSDPGPNVCSLLRWVGCGVAKDMKTSPLRVRPYTRVRFCMICIQHKLQLLVNTYLKKLGENYIANHLVQEIVLGIVQRFIYIFARVDGP